MARPYSSDLRERVLGACEQGSSQAAAARRFAVSEATVSNWRRQMREEGRRTARAWWHRGPAALGGATAVLADLVRARNDATLAEYADQLAARTGHRYDTAALCRALKRLGFFSKGRRYMPPSRSVPTLPPSARPGGTDRTNSPPAS